MFSINSSEFEQFAPFSKRKPRKKLKTTVRQNLRSTFLTQFFRIVVEVVLQNCTIVLVTFRYTLKIIV